MSHEQDFELLLKRAGALMDAKADPKSLCDPQEWWVATETLRWATLTALADVRGDPEGVARWVAPAQPELACQVLFDASGHFDVTALDATTKQAILSSALEKKDEPNPIGRASVYRVLGFFDVDQRAGVTVVRHDVGLLPDITWSDTITPGEYPTGGDEEAWRQRPSETYRLTHSFKLSQYPITNIQFQLFIDAGENGYRNPRYWTQAGLQWRGDRMKPDGYCDCDEAFCLPNHPRIYITWYEAMAFCAWLTQHYRQTGLIGGDAIIRLPLEAEWEIAARGREGLDYPYGNDFDPMKANTIETYIGQTSAVGIFPQGVSWCGASDMSGNVFEWCINPYDVPDGGQNEDNLQSNATRSLRGGCWYVSEDMARSASRSFMPPDHRNEATGFRLALIFPG